MRQFLPRTLGEGFVVGGIVLIATLLPQRAHERLASGSAAPKVRVIRSGSLNLNGHFIEWPDLTIRLEANTDYLAANGYVIAEQTLGFAQRPTRPLLAGLFAPPEYEGLMIDDSYQYWFEVLIRDLSAGCIVLIRDDARPLTVRPACVEEGSAFITLLTLGQPVDPAVLRESGLERLLEFRDVLQNPRPLRRLRR